MIMTINADNAFNTILYILKILIFVIFKNPMCLEIFNKLQLIRRC